MGYLIGDDSLKRRVQAWISYQLNHPGADGFIGPELDSLWPHVVFFGVIMAAYSATHDHRIIAALSRHYKNAERCRLLIKNDGQDYDLNERTMLHIEMLCWQLYLNTYTPDMPTVIRAGERTTLELQPMGTTRLRISDFPDMRKIPIANLR